MKHRGHPNTVPSGSPETIETLSGGHEIIGHWLSAEETQARSGPLAYVDADNNIGIHMRGVAHRPEALRADLERALANLGVDHPAVRGLVDKILERARIN